MIEAYKAGLRKAFSLIKEHNTFPVHFQYAHLNNCHPADHFKDIENFNDLMDKAFASVGIQKYWERDILNKVLGGEGWKLWVPFYELKEAYDKFLNNGGMEEVTNNELAHEYVRDAIAQCYAALDWADVRIENSKAPRQEVSQAKKFWIALLRVFKHVGYECKYSGSKNNPYWGK